MDIRKIFDDLTTDFVFSGVVESALIISVMLIVRMVLIRLLKRKQTVLSEERRRWITRIRNITFVVIFFALIMIWAPQLRTIALSLTAIAVAIVIATKELFLCLTGSIMRISTQSFRIGDWVVINNIAGEVVDLGPLGFDVQEIEIQNKTYAFTGKIVSVPYSWLLSYSVENLHNLKSFIFRDIHVTIQKNEDTAKADILSAELLKIAQDAFTPFETDALKQFGRIQRRAGLDLGEPRPQVFVKTTNELGHYVFQVRLFLPTQKAQQIASSITTQFLTRAHALNTKADSKKSKKKKA